MLNLSISEQKKIIAGWNAVIYNRKYQEVDYKYFPNRADAYTWAKSEIKKYPKGYTYCVLEG